MRLRARAPLAGFALLLLSNILSLHATTAFAALPAFDGTAYSTATMAVRVVMYVGVAVLFWRRTSEPLSPRPTGIAAAVLGLAGFTLVADPWGLALAPVAFLGAACIGCAQALLSLMWLSVLPQLTYRQSDLYILGSHAGATALCALVLTLPVTWYLPVTMAAFLGSSAYVAFLKPERPLEHALSDQAADVVPLIGKGVLAVGLFALVSGFVSRMSEQSVGDPTFQQYLVLAVSAGVLVIMSVPALAYRQPLKLESSYRVALPLSALGFLVLPGLFDAVPPAIAGTLATTGYMMCGIILSCTIAEVCKAARIASVPLYAASEVVSLFCLFVGTGLGTACAVYLPGTNTAFAVIGMGCLYLLTIGASWLVGRDRVPRLRTTPTGSFHADERLRQPRGDDGQTAEATSGTAALEPVAPLDQVAQAYRLNEQETEIFKQLVEGRTIARIAQDLYLSQSAVKYHAQKIYRACDVHTRAELTALMRQPLVAGQEPPEALPPACLQLAEQHRLTKREQQVFELLAQGRSTTDVATALDVSENTAKTHIKRLYKKLDVHSKQDIIDLVRKGDAPSADAAPTSPAPAETEAAASATA